MNATILNHFDAVKELNRVDGFDPTQVMRRISEPDANGNPTERCYLDVAYRKLWFRLKHPEGAIRKFVREITDQFAIVEAKIYLHRSDPPDSYIANAIVKRYFSSEEKFGDKYLELAETAAVGRALADAGFGLQFGDMSEVPDQSVVDAPVELPQGAKVHTITGEVMPTSQPIPDNPGTAPAEPTFTPDMPMETILSKMTMNYAVNFIIPSGSYTGKTLGQLATEKPSSLDWFVTQYKGRNNILRAAAKYLLDQAAAG